jgi:hypothetical protein
MRRIDLLELMESRRDRMRVHVQTPVETVDVNVWDELQIDEHALDVEFMALPGQLAYWSAVAARFTQSVEAIRRDFDDWFAPLYEQEFTRLEKDTGRKPNISSVEYMVKIRYREEFNGRKAALDQAETDLKIVQEIVPALQAKLQALMQLAKRQWAEYNSTDVAYKGGGVQFMGNPRLTPSQLRPDAVGVEEAKNILREMCSKNKVPF